MTVLHSPLEKSAIASAVGLAVGAVVSVQLAAALSHQLIDDIGSPAFPWIRMIAAALILLAVARPRWKGRSRSALVASVLLGGAFSWTVDPVGLGLALIAAMGWALYILLSRRVGSHFSQADDLCLSFVTAAVLLTPTRVGGFDGMSDLSLILGAAMLAILAPLLPCWTELIALRRRGRRTLGVLMCLAPPSARSWTL